MIVSRAKPLTWQCEALPTSPEGEVGMEKPAHLGPAFAKESKETVMLGRGVNF